MEQNSCKWKPSTTILLCIVFTALVVTTISLVVYTRTSSDTVTNDAQLLPENDTLTAPSKLLVRKKKVRPPPLPSFPHCAKNYNKYFMNSVIVEFIYKRIMCNTTAPPKIVITANCPNSKDQTASANNINNNETRDTILVYVAITLLLASLGAALVEVWKVRISSQKEQASVNTGHLTPGSGINGIGVRTKPELSRRCSLADLTVLRHNRRENMMRRDSAMHMSVDHGNGSGNSSSGGGVYNRVPLKSTGTLPQRPRLRVD